MLHLSFQKFWCQFFRHSDNSGLVYTLRQHVFSYKLSKFSPHPPKYHNLKEVYAIEFSKQIQIPRQNGTLPRAKFFSVNQQQKKTKIKQQKTIQKTTRDQILEKNNRAQEVSKKGK